MNKEVRISPLLGAGRMFLLGRMGNGMLMYLEEQYVSDHGGFSPRIGRLEHFFEAPDSEYGLEFAGRNPGRFSSFFLYPKYSTFSYVEDFRKLLPESPLSDREILELCELFRCLETVSEYAVLCWAGRSYYALEAPTREDCHNKTHFESIQKETIPALLRQIYDILTPEGMEPVEIPIPNITWEV